jgi:REP element-mobilizing transposase RayT
MPSSYVSNHVHIVFSTKNRLKVIPEDLQPKLWAYMAGIAKKHAMHAVAIGGIEDHAHALIDMGPTLGIAKTVQVLKANSSRERSSGGTIWMARRIFRVQREPAPGADGEALHCKPESAPSKDRFCYRV